MGSARKISLTLLVAIVLLEIESSPMAHEKLFEQYTTQHYVLQRHVSNAEVRKNRYAESWEIDISTIPRGSFIFSCTSTFPDEHMTPVFYKGMRYCFLEIHSDEKDVLIFSSGHELWVLLIDRPTLSVKKLSYRIDTIPILAKRDRYLAWLEGNSSFIDYGNPSPPRYPTASIYSIEKGCRVASEIRMESTWVGGQEMCYESPQQPSISGECESRIESKLEELLSQTEGRFILRCNYWWYIDQ